MPDTALSELHKRRELSAEQERLFYSPLPKNTNHIVLPGGLKARIVHRFIPARSPTSSDAGTAPRPNTRASSSVEFQMREAHPQPNVFLIHDFLNKKELNVAKRIFIRNRQVLEGSVLDYRKESTATIRRSQFLGWPAEFNTTSEALAKRAATAVCSRLEDVETPQLLTYLAPSQPKRKPKHLPDQQGSFFGLHHDTGDLHPKSTHFGIDPDLSAMSEAEREEYLAHPGTYRLFTVFVYFNDIPQGKEGHTVFPALGLDNQPGAGSAVIWPNVEPNGCVSAWTVHEAQPVFTEGLQKFAMNLWVHARPVRGMAPMSELQVPTPGAVYTEWYRDAPKKNDGENLHDAEAWSRRFDGENCVAADLEEEDEDHEEVEEKSDSEQKDEERLDPALLKSIEKAVKVVNAIKTKSSAQKERKTLSMVAAKLKHVKRQVAKIK